MNDLSDFDLGWLVGMLEGEGCFTLFSNNGYKHCRVQFTSTDKDVAERVKSLVGRGSITTTNVEKASRTHKKTQYRWSLGGKGSNELMAVIKPFMSVRRQQRITEVLLIDAETRERGRAVLAQNAKERIALVNYRKRKSIKGQGMVEFALILPLFLALMAGLLDGTRMLFVYNSLQEAARAGARWGSVNVGRSPWGDSTMYGNSGTYTAASFVSTPITSTGGISSTIVGQVDGKLIAIDKTLATVDIEYKTPEPSTVESGIADGTYRTNPVTVTVSYTFRPVLGFGHFGIKLVGRNTHYHE